METNTIAPTAATPGIGSLQRIEQSSDSGRRRHQNPKCRKANANAKYSNEVLYTPNGHVESEEQGVKVDVLA